MESEQAIVMGQVDRLGQLDRELADVMRNRVLLSQGKEAALRHVREWSATSWRGRRMPTRS
jgi:hypothetical protein